MILKKGLKRGQMNGQSILGGISWCYLCRPGPGWADQACECQPQLGVCSGPNSGLGSISQPAVILIYFSLCHCHCVTGMKGPF